MIPPAPPLPQPPEDPLQNRSIEERIAHMRKPFWMPYPRATDIIRTLREAAIMPRVDRMPCYLLFGASNNGKSGLVAQFRRESDALEAISPESNHNQTLLVHAPPFADEGRFSREILSALNAPTARTSSTRDLTHQARFQLGGSQVQLLLIEEFHHLICGSGQQQRAALNLVKGLSTQLRISIVAIGLSTAFNAFQTDPQLENRFQPLPLPTWKLDDDYRQLLARLEVRFALKKPSQLGENPMAKLIHMKTTGLLGETIACLRAASAFAVRTGTEQITKEVLVGCGYRGPDERRSDFLRG